MQQPNLQATRAAIAHAVRRGDAEAEAKARTIHTTALLSRQIKTALDESPPLAISQRYQLALLVLTGGRDVSDLTEARLEAHIRAAIEGTALDQPLTAEQRLRLAAVLRGLVQ